MTENDVKNRVRKTLSNMEISGDIIFYERLNSGKVKTEWGTWLQLCRAGTPDFMCITVNKKKTISVIFIETKRSVGGNWSLEQRNFNDKYTKHEDIHYFLISDPSKLAKQIYSIAYDRVNDITM
jgi:hypothetical protein